MDLVITGATGFIGRNLAEHFHRGCHRVLATGRFQAVGDELQKQGIDSMVFGVSRTGNACIVCIPGAG
jgi:nucleoside-diphosphate-sugar epimerase